MKKWLCLALIFTLSCTSVLSDIVFALAEGEAEFVESVFSEDVEPAVGPATDAGDTGLSVELGEWTVADGPEADALEADVPEAEPRDQPFTYGYGRAVREGVRVYAAAEGAEALAEVAEDAVLLADGLEASGRLKAAFDTERGVVIGYVEAGDLEPLTAAEVEAFMDAAAQSGEVALYGDSLDRPLARVRCAFIEAEAGTADAPDEADNDIPDGADGEGADPDAVPADESNPSPADDFEGGDALVRDEALGEIPADQAAPSAPALAANGAPADDPALPPEAPALLAEGTEGGEPAPFALNAESARLALGGTHVISAVTAQGDAIPVEELGFESNNPAVAAVSAAGEVSARAVGTATVTVTWGDTSLECAVTVAKVSKLTFAKSKLTVGVGEVLSAPAVTLYDKDGQKLSGVAVKYATRNKKIAAVNAATGVVKGVAAGTVEIGAAAGGKIDICKVTVKAAPKKITLSPSALTLSAEGMSARIKPSVDSGAACSTYTYESDNETVATVDPKGVVTSVGPGTATITVTAYKTSVKRTCRVTVVEPPATASFAKPEYAIGAEQPLTVSAAAADAAGEPVVATITYAIEPEGSTVASVNPTTGAVTATEKGNVTLVARTHNGVDARAALRVLPAPASVTLSYTTRTIGVGEVYRLVTAALVPPEGEDACMGTITWSTSNKKAAKVNSKGVITGVAAGKATITATTHNGKTATCKVTVKAAPTKLTMIPTKVTLGAGSAEEGYQTYNLTAKPNTASGVITWSSSDETVATVDADGMVTALSAGSATITAKAYNWTAKNKVQATCKVTVTNAPASAAFDSEEYVIGAGQPLTVRATATDAEGAAAAASFTYAIEPEGSTVASVNPTTGAVTATEKGEATLVARTHNGVEARAALRVLPAPEAIELSYTTQTIGVGEVYRLVTATLVPPEGEDACMGTITWSTNDKKAAKVNSKGVITGVAAGQAIITATTHNGETATCKVTVKAAPTKLTMTPTKVTLGAGSAGEGYQTYELTAKPNTASGVITWSSSDEAVATVDASGMVTALSPGAATITAKAYNWTAKNKVQATCKVTVTNAPASAVFDSEEYVIGAEQPLTVRATATDAEGAAAAASFTYAIEPEDSTVASVNPATGAVTATEKGEATLVARTHNGVEARATLRVLPAPGSVTLNHEEIILNMKETFSQLEATLLPPEGEDECLGTITWSSSNDAYVRVDPVTGVIKGIKGTATITARAQNGVEATCVVHVKGYRMFAMYNYFGKSGSYSGALTFPKNNASSMRTRFAKSKIDGGAYSFTVMGNPTKSAFLSGLETFANASTDYDVTIVYLCSHGVMNQKNYNNYYMQLSGSSTSTAKYKVYAPEIFDRVSAIKGNVVLIVDSCYSGAFIEDMKPRLDAEGGRIAVLTAASDTTACYYKISDTNKAVDFFTFFLLEGIGYDARDHKNLSGMKADTNKSNTITVKEFFDYAQKSVTDNMPNYSKYSWFHGNKNQKPRLYAGKLGNLVIFKP